MNATAPPPPIPPPRRQKPSINARVPFNYYGSPEKVKPIVSLNHGKIGEFAEFCDEEELTQAEDDLLNNSEGGSEGYYHEDEDDDLQSEEGGISPTIDEVLEQEHPESIVGAGVDIHGELQFERLLRIDGKFSGKLLSLGNVVVGKTGIYTGNISHLENVIVSGGTIEGNVSAEFVAVKLGGKINGNVTCKSLRVIGENNTIIGKINVNPLAPEIIDEQGDLIIEGNEVS